MVYHLPLLCHVRVSLFLENRTKRGMERARSLVDLYLAASLFVDLPQHFTRSRTSWELTVRDPSFFWSCSIAGVDMFSKNRLGASVWWYLLSRFFSISKAMTCLFGPVGDVMECQPRTVEFVVGRNGLLCCLSARGNLSVATARASSKTSQMPRY